MNPTPIALDAWKGAIFEGDDLLMTTYEVDERGLFCKHCGKTTWRHNFVRGRGYERNVT